MNKTNTTVRTYKRQYVGPRRSIWIKISDGRVYRLFSGNETVYKSYSDYDMGEPWMKKVYILD